jgi:hypothetical protein
MGSRRDASIGGMSHAERAADGSLRIHGACPAAAGPCLAWPLTVPGGRVIVVAERQGKARRFDARTGEAVGDPRRPWHVWSYGCAARQILACVDTYALNRWDLASGEPLGPAARRLRRRRAHLGRSRRARRITGHTITGRAGSESAQAH